MKMNLFSKKVLPMTLAAVMAVAPVQVMAAPSSDLAGHWAEAVITEWQEKGLIKGYEDGTFKPGNNITRAEFVTIMNNALGYEDAAVLNFTDVVAGNWYYNAVAKAVAAGYVKGYEDGTFKPDNTITRAEAAVMIANAMGLGDRGSVADEFTDAASIPSWAKGSIGAIVEAQYMSGYPDGSFGARKSITRAEAVSALNRVLIGGYSDDMVITEDDTVVENDVVAGDLIIDEKVGEGEVYLNDVEVMGDLIVNGGGEDSVYLHNVKVHGKAHVNKAGVRMHMTGKTELPKVDMKAVAKLDADKTFKGEIGTVTIAKELGTSKKVEINVPVVKLVIDAKASVVLNADVKTVEIGEGAEGVRVEIAKGVKVLKMILDAIATLAGSGTIDTLEVNIDGVTVSKNLTVEEMEVADGVKAPAITTETTTGGGGGSSSSTSSSKKYDITINNLGEGGTVTADKKEAKRGATVTLTVTTSSAEYELKELTVNDKDVTADVKEGTYTFEMPKENVVVKAEFGKIGEVTPDAPVIPEDPEVSTTTVEEFTIDLKDVTVVNNTTGVEFTLDEGIVLTTTDAEYTFELGGSISVTSGKEGKVTFDVTNTEGETVSINTTAEEYTLTFTATIADDAAKFVDAPTMNLADTWKAVKETTFEFVGDARDTVKVTVKFVMKQK